MTWPRKSVTWPAAIRDSACAAATAPPIRSRRVRARKELHLRHPGMAMIIPPSRCAPASRPRPLHLLRFRAQRGETLLGEMVGGDGFRLSGLRRHARVVAPGRLRQTEVLGETAEDVEVEGLGALAGLELQRLTDELDGFLRLGEVGLGGGA